MHVGKTSLGEWKSAFHHEEENDAPGAGILQAYYIDSISPNSGRSVEC